MHRKSDEGDDRPAGRIYVCQVMLRISHLCGVPGQNRGLKLVFFVLVQLTLEARGNPADRMHGWHVRRRRYWILSG